MPLEVQGRALPFWLPPTNISEVLDCHGCYSALNISQAMLKIVFLLVSYYKRLKTNAQDCISILLLVLVSRVTATQSREYILLRTFD